MLCHKKTNELIFNKPASEQDKMIKYAMKSTSEIELNFRKMLKMNLLVTGFEPVQDDPKDFKSCALTTPPRS